MKEYTKIQGLFKRHREGEHRGKFIEGEFSIPELEYLQDNHWVFTEKIDGTNIRVGWNADEKKVTFGGRTDNAQIPSTLYEKLQELFPVEKLETTFSGVPVCLYGEGYGAKIQKGGGNYNPDGVSFVLFDVLIDGWWLLRENIEGIAKNLEIDIVPIVGEGDIHEAISIIQNGGLKSTFGDFLAEGMVLKPKIELFTRSGDRIVTKLKHKDFA